MTVSRRLTAVHALHAAGIRGLTWRELGEQMGTHHGAASGVLSSLHKEGTVARLAQKRDGLRVYVMPGFVNGRFTDSPRAQHHDRYFLEAMPLLARITCDQHETHEPTCFRCQHSAEAFRLIRKYQREVQARS